LISNCVSKGTVKLVFQPGEEGHAGAFHMLKEGALDKIQAIFGLHVAPELATGTIGSRPGPMLAGSARFLATIRGKGGHAAAPHATRDPVLAASLAIISLQQIISRETDPLEALVGFLTFLNCIMILLEAFYLSDDIFHIHFTSADMMYFKRISFLFLSD
jgi:IAA-amino acid hydrolase